MILFNYVCLAVKFMLGDNLNINSTDLYERMKSEQVPLRNWPVWIENNCQSM